MNIKMNTETLLKQQHVPVNHLCVRHGPSYRFLDSRSLAATNRSLSSLSICEGGRWSGLPRTSRARNTSSRYRTQADVLSSFTVHLNLRLKRFNAADFSSPQLKTRQGTELLIQSEIDSVINDWYRALTETINTHVRRLLSFAKSEVLSLSRFVFHLHSPSLVSSVQLQGNIRKS